MDDAVEDRRWIVRLEESDANQGNNNGALHANLAGNNQDAALVVRRNETSPQAVTLTHGYRLLLSCSCLYSRQGGVPALRIASIGASSSSTPLAGQQVVASVLVADSVQCL